MTDERKAVDMRGAHDDGCYFCGRCECGDAEERRKALAAEVKRLRGLLTRAIDELGHYGRPPTKRPLRRVWEILHDR